MSYQDIFIIKYNAIGNVLWAKNVGGSDFDIAYSIATDASSNVIVVGIILNSKNDPSKNIERKKSIIKSFKSHYA